MLKALTNHALKMFTRFFPAEKPVLFSGPESSLKLASLLQESGHNRPLVVTISSLVSRGLLDEVFEYFKEMGCQAAVYDSITPNPTYKVIEGGIRACYENDCDSVFVVGGGSAIDAAKVIAACCSNNKSVEKVVGLLKVKKPTLPLYVVPTTSGTGSEVTSTAVISETLTHQKKFVVDAKLVPTAAALDPNMIKSLPPQMTAATGMDALTHAIEAYTSVNRFSDAERDARLAVKLLCKHLPKAYQSGESLEAREWVALGSFLAGYAFNKSGLGYVHAISHQVSAHYNTPHGLANAVILPLVMRFNRKACEARFAELERLVSNSKESNDSELADQFIARVEAMSQQLEIPGGLQELQAKDFQAIAKNACKEARMFYAVPRQMSQAECKEILAAIADEAPTAQYPASQSNSEARRRNSRQCSLAV